VHLVGFIIKKFVMMRGHVNVKFVFCTVLMKTVYEEGLTPTIKMAVSDI